jgi:tryptophan synthase alpha chain
VTAGSLDVGQSVGYGVGPVLAAAAAQGRAALIGYLPVGYPDVDTSVAAARALVEGGADVVEVGVPYSDPLMDGPVIQHAVEAALRAGARPRDAFHAVRAVAEAGGASVVMTYWNPVDRYGVDRFAADLAAAGGGGIITPDLIPDEAGEWLAAADRHQLDRIFLVAPSSTPARLAATTAACRGFVYAASTMGVTGARASVGPAAQELVARTRAVTDLPVCVGLGVSTRAQAAQVAGFADGVIVGSAFVAALAQADAAGGRTAGVDAVRALASELAAGVREGRAR